MSNHKCESCQVSMMVDDNKDDDDGVSCVTSLSRMTLGTETIHNTEDDLLQLPVLYYKVVNNGDMVQLRQLLTKYFTEDCWYQSATMDAPTHGIEHIIATVEGVMQNLPDFMLSPSNIRLEREVVSGTVIVSPRCILFERNFMGTF